MKLRRHEFFLVVVAMQSSLGFIYLYKMLADQENCLQHNDPKALLAGHVTAMSENTSMKFTKGSAHFTPVPEESRNKIWFMYHPINFQIERAFKKKGWTSVSDPNKAHIIYSYGAPSEQWEHLKTYQRWNHIPGYGSWNNKNSFNQRMMEYKEYSGKPIWAIPPTHDLNTRAGRKEFHKQLFEEGGLDRPWVLKEPNINRGKGITMLGPNSNELKSVLDKVKQDRKGGKKYIIQEYVRNTMTIDGHKFDVRTYWLVASVNPIVVLWHPGHIRIQARNTLNMTNWDTNEHLTGLSSGATADSWESFAKHLEEIKQQKADLAEQVNTLTNTAIDHTKNQMKHVLAEMVDAFKSVTFATKGRTPAENLFGFYGADFIVDNDLDTYLIEPQKGCGWMEETSSSTVKFHDDMMGGVVDVLDVVNKRQEQGLPLESKLLEHAGGSQWEVIFNDGWMYEYKGYKGLKRM